MNLINQGETNGTLKYLGIGSDYRNSLNEERFFRVGGNNKVPNIIYTEYHNKKAVEELNKLIEERMSEYRRKHNLN